MKKATLLLILIFTLSVATAQPQTEQSSPSNSEYFSSTQSVMNDLPPDDDDLNDIPIDGGLIWIILSALGLAGTKFRRHFQISSNKKE